MYCTFLPRNLGTKLKRFKLDADMARAAPKTTACLEFADAALSGRGSHIPEVAVVPHYCGGRSNCTTKLVLLEVTLVPYCEERSPSWFVLF